MNTVAWECKGLSAGEYVFIQKLPWAVMGETLRVSVFTVVHVQEMFSHIFIFGLKDEVTILIFIKVQRWSRESVDNIFMTEQFLSSFSFRHVPHHLLLPWQPASIPEHPTILSSSCDWRIICHVTQQSVLDNLLNVAVSCCHCRGHQRWDVAPEASALSLLEMNPVQIFNHMVRVSYSRKLGQWCSGEGV